MPVWKIFVIWASFQAPDTWHTLAQADRMALG
jgi:hypothetical protein